MVARFFIKSVAVRRFIEDFMISLLISKRRYKYALGGAHDGGHFNVRSKGKAFYIGS